MVLHRGHHTDITKQYTRKSVDFAINSFKKNTGGSDIQGVLDVGCGDCYGLDYFNTSPDVYGDVIGVDINPDRQKGHHVYKSDFIADKDPIESQTFDIVFINHVLEHFENPNLALRNAFDKLNDGGMVFVAVPSIKDKWAWQYESHYSLLGHRDFLPKIMKRAGFINIECTTREFRAHHEEMWFIGFKQQAKDKAKKGPKGKK